MKSIFVVVLSLLSFNIWAQSYVTIIPLENGQLHTDQSWGAINYYAKRLSDNHYIWFNNKETLNLYQPGAYEIGGESAHNICYSSRKTIQVINGEKYTVKLNIECE